MTQEHRAQAGSSRVWTVAERDKAEMAEMAMLDQPSELAAPSYRVEHGRPGDGKEIYRLYREVAAQPGGLARTQPEISEEYVRIFIEQASRCGILQVARSQVNGAIVGEIHAYPLEANVFSHVLGNLTLGVSPAHQGRGVAKLLMDALLRQVRHCHPHIERVELIVRESNLRAIRLYRHFGFFIEGHLERRIRSVGGGYEADVAMAWLRS